MNGSVLIVFSHRGQTGPRPALQHKHRIPASPLLAHEPETRTSTEVCAGLRPGAQRWRVCVAEFPVGRVPGLLDITLTGGQKTTRSRGSLQRLQSEQEPGLNVSRDSPPNCSATKTDSPHLVTRRHVSSLCVNIHIHIYIGRKSFDPFRLL